ARDYNKPRCCSSCNKATTPIMNFQHRASCEKFPGPEESLRQCSPSSSQDPKLRARFCLLLGSKQTLRGLIPMSAFGGKAASPLKRLPEPFLCNAAKPSHNLVHTAGMVVDPVPQLRERNRFRRKCLGLNCVHRIRY